MNKKGNSFNAMEDIRDLLFVLVAFIVGLVIINSLTSLNIESERTRAETAFHKIYLSQGSFSYVDETGINHPGTIDVSKFTKSHAESIFYQQPQQTGMKLTLRWDQRKEEITLNQELIEGTPTITKKIPITVIDTTKKPGTLTAEVYTT